MDADPSTPADPSRAVVVHESLWGCTAQVAEAVARGLGGARVVAAVEGVAALPDLTGVDLLVVGAPTHAFSMPRPGTREDAQRRGATTGDVAHGVRELLPLLPAHLDRLGVRVATFSTKVAHPHLPGSAAHAAARHLHRQHHAEVVGTEDFLVEDYAGPVLPGELARAEAWGAGLRRSAG